jgi:ABC-type multidrug transport system ATPase subunit
MTCADGHVVGPGHHHCERCGVPVGLGPDAEPLVISFDELAAAPPAQAGPVAVVDGAVVDGAVVDGGLHVTFDDPPPAVAPPAEGAIRISVDDLGTVLPPPTSTPASRAALGGVGPARRASATPALEAQRIWVTVPDGPTILSDVSFSAPPGTLTAVVGPTGAGKSTLMRALAGGQPPSGGAVVIGGHDLYQEYGRLESQLGHVPQEDIVHAPLTVQQALDLGAELRLPLGTDPAVRAARIQEVLEAVGLQDHADKQIARLSGGQRKRVSVSLELLTSPAVLLLDEPTSGLDPGYEQSIMQLLRRLADDGQTVLVVTHSVASLDLCDQVVFLGNGGWVGYVGPAADALAHFGVDDFPQVFRALDRPSPHPPSAPPAPVVQAPMDPDGRATSFDRLDVLVRRNVALIMADRRATLVLALAALVPSLLLMALIDPTALTEPGSAATGGARTLLSGMVITIGVIGAANGLREVVKEAPIYQRERGAGLARPAYLASKLLVLGGVTAAQAVIVLIVATMRTGGPRGGNLLPGQLELLLLLIATGIVALAMGLLISSLVSSSEKAMALIPVVFVVLWLFSGSVSALATKPGLREVAYLSPSNWGMAASASTADLLELERCGQVPAAGGGSPNATSPGSTPPSSTPPGAAPETTTEVEEPVATVCDARWRPSVGSWTWCLVVLLALGGIAFVASDWALARKEPIPSRRQDHLLGVVHRLVRPR